MNSISIYSIIFLFVIGITFLIVKKYKIDKLNKALKENNYVRALSMLSNSYNKLFLPKFIRGLYTARVYFLSQDMELLKSHLRTMFEIAYTPVDTLTYLNLYYHIFLAKEDFTFAKEILNRIEKTDDDREILCAQHAYDVLVNGRNDVIQTLETEIESKYYSGFSLGAATYLIAYQYMQNEDVQMALEWFDVCLSTLQPNDIYYKKAQTYITTLKKKSSSL